MVRSGVLLLLLAAVCSASPAVSHSLRGRRALHQSGVGGVWPTVHPGPLHRRRPFPLLPPEKEKTRRLCSRLMSPMCGWFDHLARFQSTAGTSRPLAAQ